LIHLRESAPLFNIPATLQQGVDQSATFAFHFKYFFHQCSHKFAPRHCPSARVTFWTFIYLETGYHYAVQTDLHLPALASQVWHCRHVPPFPAGSLIRNNNLLLNSWRLLETVSADAPKKGLLSIYIIKVISDSFQLFWRHYWAHSLWAALFSLIIIHRASRLDPKNHSAHDWKVLAISFY
jgi:hypothetical protein